MTEQAVLALAPDASSAKAARGLLGPSQWPRLGVDDAAVWGECKGSGAKPYQTQVDRSGPAFKCSCPSRKFPCKHGLALLLLHVQDSSRFNDAARPEWVSAWLDGRRERSEKQERKDEAQTQKIAEARAAVEAAALAGEAPAEAVLPDLAARQARRWKRIDAGLQDLVRWMSDQMSAGLATRTDTTAVAAWRALGTRMVDAQAPALATWLNGAADELADGAPSAGALLARLGRLQLLIEAVQRREGLSAATRADVRATLGWPLERDEVLVQGERLDDVWTVLGQLAEEREGRLVERRVWLHGLHSGRRALLLDFSHGTAGFDTAWVTGLARPARLAFFPSAAPLRALLLEREGPVATPPPAGSAAGRWDDEFDAAATAMATHPWLPLWPLWLEGVSLQVVDDAFWACTDTQAVPLQVPSEALGVLLALSGGGPVAVFGEWNGQVLRLLTLRSDEGEWQLSHLLGDTR